MYLHYKGSVRYSKSPVVKGWFPIGTEASFSCNHGYRHSGDKKWTCQTSGKWSIQNQPECTEGILMATLLHPNLSKIEVLKFSLNYYFLRILQISLSEHLTTSVYLIFYILSIF